MTHKVLDGRRNRLARAFLKVTTRSIMRNKIDCWIHGSQISGKVYYKICGLIIVLVANVLLE